MEELCCWSTFKIKLTTQILSMGCLWLFDCCLKKIWMQLRWLSIELKWWKPKFLYKDEWQIDTPMFHSCLMCGNLSSAQKLTFFGVHMVILFCCDSISEQIKGSHLSKQIVHWIGMHRPTKMGVLLFVWTKCKGKCKVYCWTSFLLWIIPYIVWNVMQKYKLSIEHITSHHTEGAVIQRL